jgi:HSP20 family molecular chaperone IbpA
MKKNIFNKIILAIFFFAAGVLVDWSVFHYKNKGHTERPVLSGQLNLLDQKYPFSEMDKDFFKEFESINRKFFSDDFLKGTGRDEGGPSLQQHEDEKFVYYDVIMTGAGDQKMDVSVDQGQVVITSKSELNQDAENERSLHKSIFRSSFSLPSYVDQHSFVTERSAGKLTIKFKKIQQT